MGYEIAVRKLSKSRVIQKLTLMSKDKLILNPEKIAKALNKFEFSFFTNKKVNIKNFIANQGQIFRIYQRKLKKK